MQSKVQRLAKSYSHDKNGFLKAVNDYGGMAMLNRAEEALNKKPIIKLALKAAGIDIEKVKSDINGKSTPARYSQGQSDFRSRLNRLK